MNRLIKALLFTVLMFTYVVHVSALSTGSSEVEITKGNSTNVELFATVPEETSAVNFALFYSTYDIPATFTVNGDYTYSSDGGSYHKITFDKPLSGKVKLGTVTIRVVNSPKVTTGTISLSNATAILNDESEKKLNDRVISVKVVNEVVDEPKPEEPSHQNKEENVGDSNTKPSEEEYNNLLERIDSEIVNIKLKEDVYDYIVSINPDVKELDLKPVLKDDSYKVEVSTQKIEELEDNKIKITVSKSGKELVYTITVRTANDVKIDDSKFTPTNNYKGGWIATIILLIVLLLGLVALLYIKKKK